MRSLTHRYLTVRKPLRWQMQAVLDIRLKDGIRKERSKTKLPRLQKGQNQTWICMRSGRKLLLRPGSHPLVMC